MARKWPANLTPDERAERKKAAKNRKMELARLRRRKRNADLSLEERLRTNRYDKTWLEENAEAVAAHREKRRLEKLEGHRQWAKKNPEYHWLKSMKRHAADRGLKWELDDDWAKAERHKPCFICGKPDAGSLDRWNNDIWYEKDNIRPCCPRCNTAKNDMSIEEFTIWIKRLVSFQLSLSN
jgi:hypothetical protein